MTSHDRTITGAVRTSLDRELATALGVGLPTFDRDDLADAITSEVLDQLDRHHIALVDWPTKEDGAVVVLPPGAAIDATAVQADEWTWVYVPTDTGRDVRFRSRPDARNPVDGLWIAADIVWAASALTGHWSPRLARRIDRFADWIEGLADGEADEL